MQRWRIKKRRGPVRGLGLRILLFHNQAIVKKRFCANLGVWCIWRVGLFCSEGKTGIGASRTKLASFGAGAAPPMKNWLWNHADSIKCVQNGLNFSSILETTLTSGPPGQNLCCIFFNRILNPLLKPPCNCSQLPSNKANTGPAEIELENAEETKWDSCFLLSMRSRDKLLAPTDPDLHKKPRRGWQKNNFRHLVLAKKIKVQFWSLSGGHSFTLFLSVCPSFCLSGGLSLSLFPLSLSFFCLFCCLSLFLQSVCVCVSLSRSLFFLFLFLSVSFCLFVSLSVSCTSGSSYPRPQWSGSPRTGSSPGPQPSVPPLPRQRHFPKKPSHLRDNLS